MFNKKQQAIESLRESSGLIKTTYCNIDKIRSLFDKTKGRFTSQVVDDRACEDIDFDELFMFADRTTSVVGQQHLYRKLRTPNASDFEEQETLIRYYQESEQRRLQIQYQLAKIKNNDAYHLVSLIYDKIVEQPRWLPVLYLLAIGNVVSLILFFFFFSMIYVVLAITVVNVCIHIWNKKQLFTYIHSLPLLLDLSKVTKQLIAVKVPYKKIEQVVNATRQLDRIKRRMGFFNVVVGLDNDLATMLWYALEIVKSMLLLEPIFLYQTFKLIEDKQEDLSVVFDFVGEVDSVMSVHFLRESLPFYCLPDFTAKPKQLDLQDVYHPLVINAVHNSISISGKSVLLTGSNMSGKTTFIRSVAIGMLTAQTINTCFARRFCAQPMRLHSLVRVSDDLMNSKSYYFEEVLSVKRLLEASLGGEPCLFILDEIFKGTNTVERIAAGKAVLQVLNRNDNIVFVSTHDVELAELLVEGYDLYHFCEQVDGCHIDFDYKIKHGVLKTRNAIRILEMNGYPASVVEDAKRVALQVGTKVGIPKPFLN
jgi:ABC-type Na+ transport system ATPase subunit NatA